MISPLLQSANGLKSKYPTMSNLNEKDLGDAASESGRSTPPAGETPSVRLRPIAPAHRPETTTVFHQNCDTQVGGMWLVFDVENNVPHAYVAGQEKALLYAAAPDHHTAAIKMDAALQQLAKDIIDLLGYTYGPLNESMQNVDIALMEMQRAIRKAQGK